MIEILEDLKENVTGYKSTFYNRVYIPFYSYCLYKMLPSITVNNQYSKEWASGFSIMHKCERLKFYK